MYKSVKKAKKPENRTHDGLSRAIMAFNCGNIAEAEKECRAVLSANSESAEALHLLGIIENAAGRNIEAERLVADAVRLNPLSAQFHSNLGFIKLALGKIDDAEKSYSAAVALDPNDAPSLNNYGYILRLKGNIHEAEKQFVRALRLAPDYADAKNNLGLIFSTNGEYEKAVDCFVEAIRLKPQYAEAHNNLGIVHRLAGRADKAVECFNKATAINPLYADAYNNLGNALRDLSDYEAARSAFARALELKPGLSEAYSNLGNVMKDLGHIDEAISFYQKTIDEKPSFAEAHYNIGTVYSFCGRHMEAIRHLDEAIRLKPEYAEAHWNCALSLLARGDLRRGWQEYEWRWRIPKASKNRHAAVPLWDGEDLHGKTLLMHSEQGLGDAIQFVRYAEIAAQRGGKVIVECPQTLLNIFKHSISGVDFCSEKENLPHFDVQAPFMSLPYLCGTSSDSIPSKNPYLFPVADKAERWKKELSKYSGRKIGIVWAGSPRKDMPDANAVDKRRSMDLEQFVPIIECVDAKFFSLQLGEPSEQLKNSHLSTRIADYTDEFHDFADTAAFISNLDLVIGVDTSVIHMAGALGVPVWVLSRHDGCWRWLLDRDDSPWYPTLRLFRQKKAGDWAAVVSDVCEFLRP